MLELFGWKRRLSGNGMKSSLRLGSLANPGKYGLKVDFGVLLKINQELS